MVHGLAGLKIRTLRKRAGITQAELARRARVSPSYLNLIEANKRAVAGVLLDRLAAGIGVERAALDGQAERQVVENLNEVAADPVLVGEKPYPLDAAELVGRHPAWADLVLKLYQAYLDQRQAVIALADRLHHDPFLSESIHRILTNVTAVRSAAEILEGADRLDPRDRDRFLSIVASDSRKLSDTAQSLLAFFDNAQMRVRSATPMEHVDAFIFEAGNHFPELEDFAADFLRSVPAGGSVDETAARMLPGAEPPSREPIAGASPESLRFAKMRSLARHRGSHAMTRIFDRASWLQGDESRELVNAALASYAAGAILMPYGRFLEAAENARYDLDALSRQFGVSYEQAAHRLATLRRPGSEGVRFAFMRSDPSGYVTKRLPLAGLPMPRYGSACPMWVIYGAFGTPGVTLRDFGDLPSGDSFLFFARAVEKGRQSVGLPRRLLSIMLACPASQAARVCYGDGIDAAKATVPVGTICRLCPREACVYRQEAPVITQLRTLL